MYYAVGAIFGLICLLPFFKASTRRLVQNGYLALGLMLAIYVGAHLVTSSFERAALEFTIASVVLALAAYLRGAWPLGVAFLVGLHGVYDFMFGVSSGVPAWYPPVCVGFDFVVGPGLAFLILKQRSK